MRPRLLDLFCGAGGAAMGYHRAGFEVVGVDLSPQPNYPFEFHQMDAMRALQLGKVGLPFQPIDSFDAIHASPPCQAYSTLRVMSNARVHPQLVDETREHLQEIGLPFVIENVIGAPLINPILLCGSMFGLATSDGRGLRRHRLFEVWPALAVLLQPCAHSRQTIGIYGDKARDIALEKRHYAQPKETRGRPEGVVLDWRFAEEAMGIDWMTRHEMSEAIPPAYTEFIGSQLLQAIRAAA